MNVVPKGLILNSGFLKLPEAAVTLLNYEIMKNK